MLLVLGFLTPLKAAAIIGVMVNAMVTVHRRNGVWNADGGYEYLLVLATAAAALAFTGPGLAAADPALGIMAGVGWGLLAVVVSIGAALAVLAWLREPELAESLRPHAEETTAEEITAEPEGERGDDEGRDAA